MPPQGPQWVWSAKYGLWYLVDSRTDEIVLEDGRRIPRTTFESAATSRRADANDYQEPAGQGSNYSARQRPISDQATTSQDTVRTQQAARGSSAPGGSNAQRPVRDRQDSARGTAQAISGLPLRPAQSSSANTAGPRRHDQPSITTTRENDIIKALDNVNQVQTRLQLGPRQRITDPGLAQDGIFARSALLETPGEGEQFFAAYKKRDQPRNYFRVGRVFLVLWTEPQADPSTIATGVERSTSLNKYGQLCYSKVRRFVVIREGNNSCSCLPITTYHDQGVSKRGVKKSDHSIIYTSKVEPSPRKAELPQRGEDGMQPDAIRVNVDDPTDKLSDISRLDYGRVHTIHHNLKVRNVGIVHPNSTDALKRQFRDVWAGVTESGSRRGDTPRGTSGAASSSRGNQISNAPAPLQAAATSRPERSPAVGGSLYNQSSDSQAGARRPSETSSTQHASMGTSMQDMMQRMIARGFTVEESAAAFRTQMARRQASGPQSGISQRSIDEEDSGDSDSNRSANDSDGDDQSEALGRSEGRSRRTSHSQPTRPSQAGVTRSTTSARRQSSHPRAGPPPAADSSRSNNRATQPSASGPAPGPSPAERAEQAVQHLVRQGYSRDEAIAMLRRHIGGSGRN